MSELKVLLVDDETVFVDNMSSLLNSRGYETVAVYNGENAIQVLKKEKFDVVVLDLKIPGYFSPNPKFSKRGGPK